MSKHGEQVEALLKRYPNCRNSDNDLIIGMLHVNGMFLSEADRDIIRSLNFEGITRMRRKFQERGEYLPTNPEVAKKRGFKGFVVEQTSPSLNPMQMYDAIARTV